MGIRDALLDIKSRLPSTVTLVAVSKFKSNEDILEAYNAGHRNFGENRPQELMKKMAELPADIRWHFIGHLQTNKIKMVIEQSHLIHSVNSERLFDELQKEAAKRGLVKDILLQLYIAKEETKKGLSENELTSILNKRKQNPNLRICGLMGMASFVDDMAIVRCEFANLKQRFEELKALEFSDNSHFSILSMGMSGDYNVAIEEGSTLIRVGSTIFGSR
jgi:pyridoxal phosphate enzyme, YggS family